MRWDVKIKGGFMRFFLIFLSIPFLVYSSNGIYIDKILNFENDGTHFFNVLGVSPEVISGYFTNKKMMADDFDWEFFTCSCIGGFVITVAFIWFLQIGD